jgi:hypothetical protein
VEANLGASIELKCKVQGYPKPSIAWLRADGKPLFDGTAIHYVICHNNLPKFILSNNIEILRAKLLE